MCSVITESWACKLGVVTFAWWGLQQALKATFCFRLLCSSWVNCIIAPFAFDATWSQSFPVFHWRSPLGRILEPLLRWVAAVKGHSPHTPVCSATEPELHQDWLAQAECQGKSLELMKGCQLAAFLLQSTLQMRRAVPWEHTLLFVISKNDNSGSRFSASLWPTCLYLHPINSLPSPLGITVRHMSCEVFWDGCLCSVSQSVSLYFTATSLFFSKHLTLHYPLGPQAFIITALCLYTKTLKKDSNKSTDQQSKNREPKRNWKL